MKVYHKKIWAVLLSAIMVFLVILFAFDDDSYDEQQRSIYNKLLSIELTSSGYPVYYIKQANIHYVSGTQLEDSNLLKQLKALQISNGPAWDLEIPNSVEENELPLTGLTTEELIRAALAGNAEACLRIPQEIKGNSIFGNIRNELFWFDRACQLGRPGSVFLLELTKQKEAQLPDQSPPDITIVKGYEEFRQLVKEGDIALYMAAFPATVFFAEKHYPLMNEILEALQQKINLGCMGSAKNLEWLYLVSDSDAVKLYSTPTANVASWFSDNLNIFVGETHMFPLSPAWKKQLALARKMNQAAHDGDLDSMVMWLRFGLGYYTQYDKKEWNDIFQFSNLLMSKGHAEFMKGYDVTSLAEPVPLLTRFGMLDLYYSPESVSRIHKDVLEHLRKRGSLLTLKERLLRYDSSSSKYVITSPDPIGDLIRMNNMDPTYLLNRVIYETILNAELSNDASKNVISLIRHTAETGYPEAQYVLSTILLRENSEEACKWLEKAWLQCHKYDHRINLTQHPQSQPDCKFLLSYLIAEQLSELYMNCHLPTFNPEKMAKLAQEYISFEKGKKQSLDAQAGNFYMGIIHENGYGVSENKKLALEYFLKGNEAREIKSRLALARIYEEGKIVPQDLKKALHYYEATVQMPNILPYSEKIQHDINRVKVKLTELAIDLYDDEN